ncbi:MAG TPA: reverse transcriptase domain-containing protein [Gemmataceae bacterium]|nr:reverse transcriptase domain-containing protein [Gemmataceae bacterium]
MSVLQPLTRLLPAALRLPLVPPRAPTEQARRLANILGVDVGELASIRMGPRFHYRPFTITKPDGGERRLLAPSPALKTLQRRLLDNYLSRIPIPGCATAFRPGSSVVHNARRHAGRRLIATVDLRDFFESTRAARVRAFFVKQGWRDEGLQTLMRLCVYRNGLPQGAPTSPCLSNLVNIPLDERLKGLAQRTGAVYTRYGDDLTFSWNADRIPGGFQRAVEDILHAAGYAIQPRKGWSVTPISGRPRVTGLVLTGDGRVSVPWALRWRIWCLRWKWWWSRNDDVWAKLHGYKGYVRMVR